MKIILIYLTLLTFYINEVLGAVGFGIKGISLFNMVIYLFLLFWAVSVVIQKRKVFQANNLNKYIVLMGFIVLMSIFVKIYHGEIPNISIKNEIISFKQWLNPLILFFILFNIIDDKETCDRTLLGLCFLFAALILTQLSATFGITGYKAATIEKYGRAGGFGAPGEYAITLALFIPFVLSGTFFIKRNGFFKIFSIVLVFLFLVGLINAGSRNGAVSFFFGLIVYLLILKRNRIIGMIPIFLLINALILSGAAAFLISPSSVKMAVIEKFDPSSSEDLNKFTSGRIGLWENGWRLFVDSPILGHGRDTFEVLSILRGYRFYSSAHNEYFRNLAEHGLVGFVVFILIFFKIFQNVRQSLEETTNSWKSQLYISYIAGLCGFMVGISATNTGPSLVIFWIYTAVIYKYAQLDMNKKESSKVKSETVFSHSTI